MVAKDDSGNSVPVPGLILSNKKEIRRFCNCLKQIALKKERELHEENFDYNAAQTLESLKAYNVLVQMK